MCSTELKLGDFIRHKDNQDETAQVVDIILNDREPIRLDRPLKDRWALRYDEVVVISSIDGSITTDTEKQS